jgi:hypothetical protein
MKFNKICQQCVHYKINVYTIAKSTTAVDITITGKCLLMHVLEKKIGENNEMDNVDNEIVPCHLVWYIKK